MKRFSSIVFLSIFLTYHLGYYGVYLIMEYKIERHWQEKISGSSLNPHDLEKISTPLSLPYRADQNEYQTASGSITINGQFYRFVKYKYAQDTLHLLYVKDNKMASLHKALRDWAVSFTSIPVSKSGSVELWKSMCKDLILKVSSRLNFLSGNKSELGKEYKSGYRNTYSPKVLLPPPQLS